MRLLRVSTLPIHYLDQFYADNAELVHAPYELQHARLMFDAVRGADFWKEALRPYGCEIIDIVANASNLQKQWHKELTGSDNKDGWLYKIITKQVQHYCPDILFFSDYSTFSAEYIKELKQSAPSVRSVIIWCGAPYRNPAIFRESDIVLSCIPELVSEFNNNGLRSELMMHAFDPRILNRIDMETIPDINLSFIGSLVGDDQFHKQRERLLLELIQSTELTLFANINKVNTRDILSITLKQLAYDIISRLKKSDNTLLSLLNYLPQIRKVRRWQERPVLPAKIDKRVISRSLTPVYGLSMFQSLRKSRVTLNTHIDLSARFASNMRLFEATGVGTCLLTDWKENISDLFVPDQEIVTYRNADDCREKVLYLLDNEPYRKQIAAAGQSRVLRDHTFARRAPQMMDIIKSLL